MPRKMDHSHCSIESSEQLKGFPPNCTIIICEEQHHWTTCISDLLPENVSRSLETTLHYNTGFSILLSLHIPCLGSLSNFPNLSSSAFQYFNNYLFFFNSHNHKNLLTTSFCLQFCFTITSCIRCYKFTVVIYHMIITHLRTQFINQFLLTQVVDP